MLGEIVRTALEQEPDLELIPASLSSLLAATQPDAINVVIMVLPGGTAVSECREMLSRYPGIRLLAVLEDERGDASLFELQPRDVRFGSLSPTGVAEAIRRAASR